ncbi:MAG: DUF488 domain-containing protein [Thaumarchaeota archaeon]|nr:DUF488 domain-containing protein [Nitrososphaerota archaeon]
MIKIKRAYDKPSKEDGYRILVDRLWPRGVSKDEAKIDLWLKEISPSNELREWFSHDPKKWEGFKSKYRDELKEKAELIKELKKIEKEKKTITLLYSAKDEQHNNVIVLSEILKNRV